MLTGKPLGEAIERARVLKGVPKTTVAAHFGIKGPSYYDWANHGRVSKAHLPELIRYFSDVVGPEHWGLSSADPLAAQSHPVGLDGAIVRAAIRLAKKTLKLHADDELVIENDPELFAQALRTAIASRQRKEADGDVGSGSGDGQAGATGGASGGSEAGAEAKPSAGKGRKRARAG